uniref:serine protease HTRA3-like n=1 Tax=Halichoerus grypus TaxID=9711 RepID=UPI001658D7F9|nr:serine protease HTRA3-like [Halichoerus grypus]
MRRSPPARSVGPEGAGASPVRAPRPACPCGPAARPPEPPARGRARPSAGGRRPAGLGVPAGPRPVPALPPAPPAAMPARALLLAALAALALAREPPAAPCPARCDVSRCPSPRCPGGYVPDLCNCCLVCAASEGEPCGRPLDSPCGESLECARGVCRCRWAHAVCGTDGHTYANVCALQAASRRALELSGTPVRQLQKGACPSGKRSARATAAGWEGRRLRGKLRRRAREEPRGQHWPGTMGRNHLT